MSSGGWGVSEADVPRLLEVTVLWDMTNRTQVKKND